MAGIGFAETIIMAALIAFVSFIVAMPVGSRFGSTAGKRMLLGVSVAFLLVVGASVFAATSNGQLTAFKVAFGGDGLLQIGAFILMVLLTTLFFASRYLDDLDR